MPRTILYIATSLDGYIATPDGGVEWLEGYEDALAGFDEFIAGIGAALMGRATYDFAANSTWQFKLMPVGVLTSRPIDSPPPGVFAHPGPAGELLTTLYRRTDNDIWLVGGGRTIRAFLDANLVDLARIFVIPTLLGNGIPLFPPGACNVNKLDFVGIEQFDSGVVEITYERPP
jgi:dihydrofolate reductase